MRRQSAADPSGGPAATTNTQKIFKASSSKIPSGQEEGPHDELSVCTLTAAAATEGDLRPRSSQTQRAPAAGAASSLRQQQCSSLPLSSPPAPRSSSSQGARPRARRAAQSAASVTCLWMLLVMSGAFPAFLRMRSATRNASSSDCLALSLGSHAVS